MNKVMISVVWSSAGGRTGGVLINDNDGTRGLSFSMNRLHTAIWSGYFTNFVMATACIFIPVVSMNISILIFPLVNLVSQVLTIDPSVNSVNETVSFSLF